MTAANGGEQIHTATAALVWWMEIEVIAWAVKRGRRVAQRREDLINPLAHDNSPLL